MHPAQSLGAGCVTNVWLAYHGVRVLCWFQRHSRLKRCSTKVGMPKLPATWHANVSTDTTASHSSIACPSPTTSAYDGASATPVPSHALAVNSAIPFGSYCNGTHSMPAMSANPASASLGNERIASAWLPAVPYHTIPTRTLPVVGNVVRVLIKAGGAIGPIGALSCKIPGKEIIGAWCV